MGNPGGIILTLRNRRSPLIVSPYNGKFQVALSWRLFYILEPINGLETAALSLPSSTSLKPNHSENFDDVRHQIPWTSPPHPGHRLDSDTGSRSVTQTLAKLIRTRLVYWRGVGVVWNFVWFSPLHAQYTASGAWTFRSWTGTFNYSTLTRQPDCMGGRANRVIGFWGPTWFSGPCTFVHRVSIIY